MKDRSVVSMRPRALPAVDPPVPGLDIRIDTSKLPPRPHAVSPQRKIRDTAARTTAELEASRSWVSAIAAGGPPAPLEQQKDAYLTLPRKAAAIAGVMESASLSSVASSVLDYRPDMFKAPVADVYGDVATSKFIKEYKRLVRAYTFQKSMSPMC